MTCGNLNTFFNLRNFIKLSYENQRFVAKLLDHEFSVNAFYLERFRKFKCFFGRRHFCL